MIEKIIDLCEEKYCEFDKRDYIMITGDYSEIEFNEFEENKNYELNYEDDFFYELQINRFNNTLLFEFIMLGDEVGYYKDWSFKKFVSSMKNTCEADETVYVSNYDDSDDTFARAFFLAMTVAIDDYNNFYEAYKFTTKRCKDIIRITEDRLKGISWNIEFESDEKLFCELYLTKVFKNIGFNKVRYNHGNKEFGKDYLLETTNIFKEIEYYAVQVKAGGLSGNAKANLYELTSQIKSAFKVPYKDFYSNDIYISKLIVVCSGNISENAKEIIKNDIEKYMHSNIMFLDKRYFLSLRDEITKL